MQKTIGFSLGECQLEILRVFEEWILNPNRELIEDWKLYQNPSYCHLKSFFLNPKHLYWLVVAHSAQIFEQMQALITEKIGNRHNFPQNTRYKNSVTS